MQGRQEYQPKLFSVIDIEKRIPQNHLLRKIDRVLDLSFIREMTKYLYCQDNGRPSIDPELFFRICLITHLYNIPSDRQVCEELDYNLAYKWFCRLNLEDSVPDHSSLTKIRDRLGEETFKKIFERIVQICVGKGLVKGSNIMMDASYVKANAAMKSLVEKDEEGNPKETKPPKNIKGRKYSNETHVSYTDPDCALAGKIKEPKQLRYKVHSIADESRVIIDTHITDGAVHDGKMLLGRLGEVESNFGFKIEQVIADRGYGFGESLQELENREIKSYVPNFHKDVGETFDPELFKYDEANDRFTCPRGFLITFGGTQEYRGSYQHKIYRLLGGHCQTCPMASKCFPTALKVPRGKRIVRNVHWKIQEKTKTREAEADFIEARRVRQWKMEGLFAEGKNFHGLGRARYRRRNKMQIQAYMIASVQNLKRLAEALDHFIELLLASGHTHRKNSTGVRILKLFGIFGSYSPASA